MRLDENRREKKNREDVIVSMIWGLGAFHCQTGALCWDIWYKAGDWLWTKPDGPLVVGRMRCETFLCCIFVCSRGLIQNIFTLRNTLQKPSGKNFDTKTNHTCEEEKLVCVHVPCQACCTKTQAAHFEFNTVGGRDGCMTCDQSSASFRFGEGLQKRHPRFPCLGGTKPV